MGDQSSRGQVDAFRRDFVQHFEAIAVVDGAILDHGFFHKILSQLRLKNEPQPQFEKGEKTKCRHSGLTNDPPPGGFRRCGPVGNGQNFSDEVDGYRDTADGNESKRDHKSWFSS